MKSALAWLLWLVMCLVIVGAFLWAPLAKDFIGQSSRILFFHVPMAWTAFVAFFAAGIWSVRYLAGGRRPEHDRAAQAAVELGLLFCVLATVTGAMWARTMWGAFWNWDPRQTSITFALLYYAAYLALRGSVQDLETRRRLAAAFAALGLVVAPFLFFVAPRLAFTLHPEPVLNAAGKVEMNRRMLAVLLTSAAAFTALFFWIHAVQRRILALRERQAAAEVVLTGGRPA
jgi:heme exporter protein C